MEPQKLPLIPLYVTPGLPKQKEVAILKKVGFNNNKVKQIFELNKTKHVATRQSQHQLLKRNIGIEKRITRLLLL